MRDTEPLVITRDYINDNKTKRGAWTKVQIEALGIEWPPKHGWIDRLIGEVISPEQANRFEQGKEIRSSANKDIYWHVGEKIIKNVDKLTDRNLMKLFDFVRLEMEKRKLN